MKPRPTSARRATATLTRRSPRRSRPTSSPAQTAAAPPLSDRERLFVAEYFAHHRNATRAYLALSPTVKLRTAQVEGHKLRHLPQVDAAIQAGLADYLTRAQMTGEEAAGRVGLDARSDIRQLFDERGQMLPPHKWPDDIAQSVESYELTQHGYRVKLVSKNAARRTILEITGKLKNAGDAIANTLEAILGASRTEAAGE